MSTPQVGSDFGRYHLDRLLGRGGMGMVFEAVDTTLNRPVALKIILPSLSDIDAYRERFSREAATLARVRSRHIVQIHEYGEHEGSVYLVTELFPDGDLAHWMDEHGPLSKENALTPTAQVCEGLQDAHDAGVIHRDIKPSNVLLWHRNSQLIPYLCDFGIAGGEGGELTRSGTVMGSLSYMAPERNLGHPADESGDIYSAGCLLWAALTGEPPYSGTDFQLMKAHVEQPIPQLPSADPLTNRINDLLQTGMAKTPAHRFHTAAAFRDAILEVLADTNVHSPTPAPLERSAEEVTGYTAPRSAAAPAVTPDAQPEAEPDEPDDATNLVARTPLQAPSGHPDDRPADVAAAPGTRYVRISPPTGAAGGPATGRPAAAQPDADPAFGAAPTAPRPAVVAPSARPEARRPWLLPLAIGAPIVVIAVVAALLLHGNGPSRAAAPAPPSVAAKAAYRAVTFTATPATSGPGTDAIQYLAEGSWHTGRSHTVSVGQGGDRTCLKVRARTGDGEDAAYSDVVKRCATAQPRRLDIRYRGFFAAAKLQPANRAQCPHGCYVYDVDLVGFATGTTPRVDLSYQGRNWCVVPGENTTPCYRRPTVRSDGTAIAEFGTGTPVTGKLTADVAGLRLTKTIR